MALQESLAVYQSIPGGPELLAWFGGVPTFHDAEILCLKLDRSGPSTLVIHGWVMTDKVDAEGYFVLDRHVVVTFLLEEIADLRLEGFTAQNVIHGLRLRRLPLPTSTRDLASIHRAGEVIELALDDCYGLSGVIWARSASVRFEPGTP
jgi:hypothetical protein